MRPTIDLTGQRFGRLVVLRYSDKRDGRKAWVCQCDCGTLKEIRGEELRRGTTVSCGCYRAERIAAGLNKPHGKHGTPTYDAWRGMLDRCYKKSHTSYARYGGRGIGVCDRWRQSVDAFFEDMGEKPLGLTLERRDSNKDYSLDNCRWATVREQNNNKSDTWHITWNGKTQTMSAWAAELGMSQAALHYRLTKMKLSVEVAFTMPISRKNNRRQQFDAYEQMLRQQAA